MKKLISSLYFALFLSVLFLITGCEMAKGPTAPQDITNDIVEPLLQKSTSQAFQMTSGVFEVEAILTPPAPVAVSVGSPISATVDFGMNFSSIEQICFIVQFQDNLLDPGEQLTYGPFVVVGTGSFSFGFLNPGPNPQSARTVCNVNPSVNSFFLDGQQDFGIQMETGSVVIASLKVQITGEPIFPQALIELDIKPQSCPNPLNTKSKGVLPVAVLGTANLDVNDIDVSTVQLEGVDLIRSSIEDVATPVTNRQDCDCTIDGPDGFDDLTLKFDTQAIVAALEPVDDGDPVVLTLTGQLLDGTPIEGKDCVIINKK